MNPEQLLVVVAEAITHRPTSVTGAWWVCWFDGKIQCLPSTAMPPPECRFLLLTEKMVQDGLNDQEWTILRNRLWNFFKDFKP